MELPAASSVGRAKARTAEPALEPTGPSEASPQTFEARVAVDKNHERTRILLL